MPIDVLLQNVYQTVDTRLDEIKNSVLSAREMEALLMEVEQGQIRLESQLNVLRDKNKEIVTSLKIPMPEVAGPTLLDNDFMR